MRPCTQVTWVGRSSLEVTVELLAMPPGAAASAHLPPSGPHGGCTLDVPPHSPLHGQAANGHAAAADATGDGPSGSSGHGRDVGTDGGGRGSAGSSSSSSSSGGSSSGGSVASMLRAHWEGLASTGRGGWPIGADSDGARGPAAAGGGGSGAGDNVGRVRQQGQQGEGGGDTEGVVVATARLLMAARDVTMKHASVVAALVPESGAERALFAQGQERHRCAVGRGDGGGTLGAVGACRHSAHLQALTADSRQGPVGIRGAEREQGCGAEYLAGACITCWGYTG